MTLPLTAAPKTGRWRSAFDSKRALPAALIAVLIALAGWFAWQALRGVQLPGTPASAETIEAKWGIRIQHIGVSADGGLIDFRYVVLDPDKAAPLASVENRPRLFVESTGALVDSLMHPPHSHEPTAGQSHYLLYNNTHGAIRRGTSVSVLLGDLRLEHIIAK
jgi:hypothetical protein